MKTPKPSAGSYPVWTPEEDARLLEKLAGRQHLGQKFWIGFAAEFSGRSFYALRQRYLVLRMAAQGIKREAPVRSRVTTGRERKTPREIVQVAIRAREAAERLQPESLTAALLGDPLPGRSALDRKRAGIADEPPAIDHRTAYYASRPKITLATEPLR